MADLKLASNKVCRKLGQILTAINQSLFADKKIIVTGKSWEK